jgi:hypothetical protein
MIKLDYYRPYLIRTVIGRVAFVELTASSDKNVN